MIFDKTERAVGTQGYLDLLWKFDTWYMKERRLGPAIFAKIKTARGFVIANRAFLWTKLTVTAIVAVKRRSDVTDRARRFIKTLNLAQC